MAGKSHSLANLQEDSFHYCHLCGSSELSVIPVLGDLTPFPGLCWHQVYMCIDMHAGRISVYKIYLKLIKTVAQFKVTGLKPNQPRGQLF